MNHSKRGFTLIELLAVIVVLGIILAIAIPKITESINNFRISAFEDQKKIMLKVARDYIQIHGDDDGTNDGMLTYGFLIDKGKLKSGIKDEKGKLLSKFTLINTNNTNLTRIKENETPESRITANSNGKPLPSYKIYGNTITKNDVVTSLGEGSKNVINPLVIHSSNIVYDKLINGYRNNGGYQNIAPFNWGDYLKPNTTYTLFYNFTNDVTSNPNLGAIAMGNGYTHIMTIVGTIYTKGWQRGVFTTPSDLSTATHIWIYSPSVLEDFMILEGNVTIQNKPTKYIPYRYIDVVSSSKNIFDAYNYVTSYPDDIKPVNQDGEDWIKMQSSTKQARYNFNAKENTQYTFTFEFKRYDDSGSYSTNFALYYTDGTSETLDFGYYGDGNLHKVSRKSAQNKTISYIRNGNNGNTVYFLLRVNGSQIEEGITATTYEPYKEKVTTTIDLTGHGPLRSLDNIKDYIEYPSNKLVRKIGVRENGELYILSEPIIENITLPSIPTYDGVTNITIPTGGTISAEIYNK